MKTSYIDPQTLREDEQTRKDREGEFEPVIPREDEIARQNDAEVLKQQQLDRHAEIAEQERQAKITRQNIIDAAKYK